MIMANNRGSVPTHTIAGKLKKVEEELSVTSKISNTNTSTPLLFVNGRLNRKKYSYIAKNFALLESLDIEIKSLCKGSDLTILNYLIALGLQKIKEDNNFKSIEYSNLESVSSSK